MNIIFPVSVVDGIIGGFMNARRYARMYLHVGVHACMCVRLANDFINVKKKTKQLISCEEIPIPTFYRKATFLLGIQNFTEAVASFASYVHVASALPLNSVSVITPAKEIM